MVGSCGVIAWWRGCGLGLYYNFLVGVFVSVSVGESWLQCFGLLGGCDFVRLLFAVDVHFGCFRECCWMDFLWFGWLVWGFPVGMVVWVYSGCVAGVCGLGLLCGAIVTYVGCAF